NGRKQVVSFFRSRANLEETTPGTQPTAPPGEPVYSNRRAEIGNAKAATDPAESNITIMAIATGSLAWADLVHTRDQMYKFLKSMPTGERIGIYVQTARGFQVLSEATSDRARLVSALRQWMPTARELAQAQEMEQRNRQQIDEVSNAESLQYVNGNLP